MDGAAQELRDITESTNSEKRKQVDSLRLEAQQEAAPIVKQVLAEARVAANKGQFTIRIAAIRTDIDKLSSDGLVMLIKKLEEEGFKVDLGIGTYYDGSISDLIESTPRHDIEAHGERMDRIEAHTKSCVNHIILSWYPAGD